MSFLFSSRYGSRRFPRDNSEWGGVIARLGATLCVVGCLLFASACQPDQVTETQSFEHAELAYRQGRYQRAMSGYQTFLKRYPSSPLAQIATLRLRTIEREQQGMLGRTDTPPPLYRGEDEDAMKIDALPPSSAPR